jgi:dienelactone hydrolase
MTHLVSSAGGRASLGHMLTSMELTRGLALAATLLFGTAPPADRVTVTTPDGSLLAARFFDAGPGAAGVLFFPMCASGWSEGWAPVAERLRQAGVSSLLVSYRGTEGNTTGTGTGDQRPADADSAFAFLRSRIGSGAPVAVAGSSCGVYMALRTATAHPEARAVVVLSGPHTSTQLEYVRRTPSLAVFSGATTKEPPSPEWAQALRDASANPASRVVISDRAGHGTDQFAAHPTLANDIADWIVAQLRATAR